MSESLAAFLIYNQAVAARNSGALSEAAFRARLLKARALLVRGGGGSTAVVAAPAATTTVAGEFSSSGGGGGVQKVMLVKSDEEKAAEARRASARTDNLAASTWTDTQGDNPELMPYNRPGNRSYDSDVTFDDVAGQQLAKDLIYNSIVLPLNPAYSAAIKNVVSKGILMYGVPGK
jgi:hypothetical protein